MLDAQPLTIGGSADFLISPVVAWSGADYLVALGTNTAAAAKLIAQRLKSDGTISGAPIALDDRGGTSSLPMAIAADANGCWISWSDADVHLAHVGASGVDVAPAVIANSASWPTLAPGSIAYSLTDPDHTIVVVRDLPAHPRRRTAGH